MDLFRVKCLKAKKFKKKSRSCLFLLRLRFLPVACGSLRPAARTTLHRSCSILPSARSTRARRHRGGCCVFLWGVGTDFGFAFRRFCLAPCTCTRPRFFVCLGVFSRARPEYPTPSSNATWCTIRRNSLVNQPPLKKWRDTRTPTREVVVWPTNIKRKPRRKIQIRVI